MNFYKKQHNFYCGIGLCKFFFLKFKTGIEFVINKIPEKIGIIQFLP